MFYVSDLIKEEYKQWGVGNRVIINTPTGSGKTTFIKKVLLPYAMETGETILLLVNRRALKRQLENELGKNNAYIMVETYQQFYQYFEEKNTCLYFSFQLDEKIETRISQFCSAKYWVMDEAHYFLADAEFNEEASSCYDVILQHQKTHVSVYITATPTYLYLLMSDVKYNFPLYINESLPQYDEKFRLLSPRELLENHGYPSTYADNMRQLMRTEHFIKMYALLGDWIAQQQLAHINAFKGSGTFHQKEFCTLQKRIDEVRRQNDIFVYEKEADYSYLIPHYYIKQEEILNTIQQGNADEKWVIFVRSNKDGQNYRAELRSKGIEAVFINKLTRRLNKKDPARQALDSIQERGSFSCQVLITTSVLDNGISIQDKQVKHLVVATTSRTEFLQMLGRVRQMDGDTRLHLYVQDTSIGKVERDFTGTWQTMRFWQDLYRVQQLINDMSEGLKDKNNKLMKVGTAFFERANTAYRSSVVEFRRRYTKNGSLKEPFCGYVQFGRNEVVADKLFERNHFLYLFTFFKPIEALKCRITYDFFDRMTFLERVTRAEEAGEPIEYPWVKEQLSWLGLEYDPACWLNADQLQIWEKEFLEQLEHYQHEYMSPEEQKTFRALFQNYVTYLRPVCKAASRKGSLQTINQFLSERGYPYQIVSRQRTRQGKQLRRWIVERVENERETEG